MSELTNKPSHEQYEGRVTSAWPPAAAWNRGRGRGRLVRNPPTMIDSSRKVPGRVTVQSACLPILTCFLRIQYLDYSGPFQH